MATDFQNYLTGIQNAFSGSRYVPGDMGHPSSYNQPNLPRTVAPVAPIYDPTRNAYGLPTIGTPRWNGTHFVNEMGQPFTGTYGGQTYTNGQSYQQAANSPSRYTGIDITKNAPVAAATDQLLAGFKPTQGVTDFSSLLDAARTASGAAKNAFAADQSAYNVQPLADTLNNLNTSYTATGNALNNRYSNIVGNTAANQNNIVNQSSGLLPQQFNALQGINNQYANTAGTLTNALQNNLDQTKADQAGIVNQAYGMLPGQFGALTDINNQFANTGNNLDAKYSGILGNTNATENGIVQQAQDLLPSYDTAANNIGDYQTKVLQGNVSRYKLGTGTPMSLGGGEENLLANGVAAIRLPLEQQKINQRYNLLQNLNLPIAQQQQAAALGQVQNFEMPLASDVANRNTATQLGLNAAQNNILQNMQLPLEQQQSANQANLLTNTEIPLAQDITNRNYGTQSGLNAAQQNLLQGIALPLAGQQGAAQVNQLTGFTAPLAQQDYTNAATTAQTIQNLKLQIAGKSIAEATQLLQAMAVPIQIQQQLLAGNQSLQSGDIGNLAGLNSLYSGSRYQGLQDTFGANLSTPTVSTFSPGGFPSGGSPSRYNVSPSGNGTGTSGFSAGNLPTTGNVPSGVPTPAAQPQTLPQGAWSSTLQVGGVDANGQQFYVDPKTGNKFYVVDGQIYPYYANSSKPAPAQSGRYNSSPTIAGAVENAAIAAGA